MIKISMASTNTCQSINCEFIQFPGGERHVRFTSPRFGSRNYKRVIIEWLPKNSNDIMDLLLVKDAIDRGWSHAEVELHILYMPYARQDRVVNFGESLSIKVMADLINNLNCNKVFIYDPHSDVTPALIDRCTVISQRSCIQQTDMMKTVLKDDQVVLVAPDAGALKKTQELAHAYGKSFLIGGKVRNSKTGELTGFTVDLNGNDPESLSGAKLWIIDDICDGGGTFLGLSSELKKVVPHIAECNLYVTHGIFSKGIESLTSTFNTVVSRFDWS